MSALDLSASWDESSVKVLAAISGGPQYRPAPASPQGKLGVLYSAAGTAEFCRREVFPALKLATSTEAPVALCVERSVYDSLTLSEKKEMRAVDELFFFEDYKPAALSSRTFSLRAKAKLVKIVAMAASPFETTIYLDFDSRPCRPDFAKLLALETGNYDLALTNKYLNQETRSHFDLEHNSACIVLRKTMATQTLLELWLDAFLRLGNPRDQPSLMIALKAAERRGDIRHKDLGPLTFCRSKTSPVVSCDAGCIVVHKPEKHDLSMKVFVVSAAGGETVARMLEAIKIEPRCDVAVRLRLTDTLLTSSSKSAVEEVVAAAEPYRVFWDMPWAYEDVYASLSATYPRAKFVFVRPTFEWARDTTAAVRNCGSDRHRRKVRERFRRLYGPVDPQTLLSTQETRLKKIRRALPADKLLELDLQNDPPSTSWRKLCAFVQAWTACPATTRSLPPSTPPVVSCDGDDGGYDAILLSSKNRSSRAATPTPPKPLVRRKIEFDEGGRKASEIPANPPTWHPLCSPRKPRGVFYNRLPKSGSASVMSWMASQLNATARKEGKKQTEVTWWTPHVAKHRWLSPSDEREFVATVRRFGELGEFVSQRHVYHTPSLKSSHPRGVELVNVARDPIDRCVSRYNYEAFYKKRIPPVDFNDCLDDKKEAGCNLERPFEELHVYKDYPVPKSTATAADRAKFLELSHNQSMMLVMDECHDYMTRWFCGHGPECRWSSDRALEIAKRNVVDEYAHVGVLEDLPNTVQLFRLLLPTFFGGDPRHTPDEADFPELHSQKTLAKKDAHLPKAAKTKSGPLSPRNLLRLFEANRRDIELYYFILDRHRRRVKLCLHTNGSSSS